MIRKVHGFKLGDIFYVKPSLSGCGVPYMSSGQPEMTQVTIVAFKTKHRAVIQHIGDGYLGWYQMGISLDELVRSIIRPQGTLYVYGKREIWLN
jgi:hypothetical protein